MKRIKTLEELENSFGHFKWMLITSGNAYGEINKKMITQKLYEDLMSNVNDIKLNHGALIFKF